MERIILAAAGVYGFLGVAAGAFGAHAVSRRLSPDLLKVYETGALYHLLHAVALLGVALLLRQRDDRLVMAAGWLFVAGIPLFSGTLYTLALSGTRWLGAVAPVGGVSLLAGWLCLAVAGFKDYSGTP